MRAVTLGDLLANATPYERWAAPLDRRLAICVILSGAAIGLVLGLLAIGLVLLPATVAGPMQALLLAADLAGAALFAGVVLGTGRLRHGRSVWHRLAFAVAMLGALNGLLIALAAAALLLIVFVAAVSAVARIFGPGTFGAHLLPLLLILPAVVVPILVIRAITTLVDRPAGASADAVRSLSPPGAGRAR